MWSEGTFHVIKIFKCVNTYFYGSEASALVHVPQALEKNVYHFWWVHIFLNTCSIHC